MRLLLLPLLAAGISAADLPITGVTVIPGGLVIERAGAVPAGDDAITGLPATLDEGSLSLSVDGREIDGWRLVRPEPPAPAPADPAAQQRLETAERSARTANLRAELAAGASHVTPAKDDAPPRQPPAALPGPEAIRSQVAFAAINAERSAGDAQAAAEAADAARNALAAAPGVAPPPPVLRAPGIAGHSVRIRYLLPGANWAPAWRLEVDGGDATLIQLATIEVQSRDALPAVPLTIASRGRADAAVLADPRVPILGLAESVELERTPAALAAKGSKGSESAVDGGLRAFKRVLSEGSGSVATDAQVLLVMLGAGYDHKTPNKYKTVVGTGLARIGSLDPAQLELPVLALATTALAEAYAMTNDPELRPRAEAFVTTLRNRWPRELSACLAASGPLQGPETAALVVQALKSAYAGGLPMGDDLRSLRGLELGGGEEAELARLLIDVYSGGRAPFIDGDTARRWVASFDRWWNGARTDLIAMAVLVAFQNGGEEWATVNGSLRGRLIDLQIPTGPDAGLWPLEHHPLGRLYGSAQTALCLEIYYRYAQVSAGKPSLYAAMVESEPAPPPPPVQPAWPVRITADHPVSLQPGRQVVELRRARLAGAITWEAVPVQSPGVWRHLTAPNPWSAPLPGGPVSVVADGRNLGQALLPAIAPGAAVSLDLGPDDRLRVRRTVRSATDDGVFKRTLTLTVTCRLEAPSGFAAPVRIREPLPRPGGDLIAVELVRPLQLTGEAYAKHVEKEPDAATTLSATTPEAVISELRLVYPRSVRPRLEAR